METYFAQNGLPCLLCGRTYLALHLHLNKTHEMALDDYRARYGIPWTRGLVAKLKGSGHVLHDITGYTVYGRRK
jgi:predicted transcriptional regulator